MNTMNRIGGVAPGSTAYTTGNDAFTAVTLNPGTKTLNICGQFDAAAYPIIRLGSTNINLNNKVALAAGAAFTFAYQVSPGDGTVSVRFSANGNIEHLLVTEGV